MNDSAQYLLFVRLPPVHIIAICRGFRLKNCDHDDSIYSIIHYAGSYNLWEAFPLKLLTGAYARWVRTDPQMKMPRVPSLLVHVSQNRCQSKLATISGVRHILHHRHYAPCKEWSVKSRTRAYDSQDYRDYNRATQILPLSFTLRHRR